MNFASFQVGLPLQPIFIGTPNSNVSKFFCPRPRAAMEVFRGSNDVQK